MDTTEMMVNNEVLEATEEIATAGSGKGFKMVAGIGLAVLVGGMAYRYIAKPMIAKIKARKEAQAQEAIVLNTEDTREVEEDEE